MLVSARLSSDGASLPMYLHTGGSLKLEEILLFTMNKLLLLLAHRGLARLWVAPSWLWFSAGDFASSDPPAVSHVIPILQNLDCKLSDILGQPGNEGLRDRLITCSPHDTLQVPRPWIQSSREPFLVMYTCFTVVAVGVICMSSKPTTWSKYRDWEFACRVFSRVRSVVPRCAPPPDRIREVRGLSVQANRRGGRRGKVQGHYLRQWSAGLLSVMGVHLPSALDAPAALLYNRGGRQRG